MTDEQKIFFNELKAIQTVAVDVSLSKVNSYETTEDMLTDVTYEVIYRVMELLDGYRNEAIKCKLVNTKTGNALNENIEMHDVCAEFLESADV